MAKTLAQIQLQIAELQRQAEEIRSKEIDGVIGRIREAIAHYGLTERDLFGDIPHAAERTSERGRASASRKKGNGAVRSPARSTYRDESGNTWSGRGRKPNWLVAALSNGRSLDEFREKSDD